MTLANHEAQWSRTCLPQLVPGHQQKTSWIDEKLNAVLGDLYCLVACLQHKWVHCRVFRAGTVNMTAHKDFDGLRSVLVLVRIVHVYVSYGVTWLDCWFSSVCNQPEFARFTVSHTFPAFSLSLCLFLYSLFRASTPQLCLWVLDFFQINVRSPTRELYCVQALWGV